MKIKDMKDLLARGAAALEAPADQTETVRQEIIRDLRAAEEALAEEELRNEKSIILATPEGPELWLISVRGALLDLLTTAREGARRARKRILSRAEIRRQAREAYACTSALLDEGAEVLRAVGTRWGGHG
jgi:hypothetical protein